MTAIFLIGYITFVFGVETLIRAYRQERFAPRGNWNTSVCIAVVSLMLLFTWVPTVVWPMSRTCFGSLIWFPMRYDLLMLSILSVLVFLLLLVAALISVQLMRTPDLDHNERISASRMTYFLVVTALIYVSCHDDSSLHHLILIDARYPSRSSIATKGVHEGIGSLSDRRDLAFLLWHGHYLLPSFPPYERNAYGHSSHRGTQRPRQTATPKTTILWP